MAQAKMDFILNTRVDKTAFIELKKEIQSLRGLTEKDLIDFGSASSFQEAKKQLAEIKNSATTVETALNKAFSPKLGTISLTKFNNELKGINLQQLANNFNKAGAAGASAFRSLTTNVLTTKIQIKETHKLLDDMGKTMSNTIKWGISSSAWNAMTGSFQKAYNYVKDLDRSLNNIRIVSEKSADDMARFAVQANKAAKALGSTTLDYTDASLIYYQQGLPDDEVTKRTDATIKMANVLGVKAEEVSDYMTSIWNNFAKGGENLEYYADVLTKLGAATASSAEEISTGLEKFAAISSTVGLSYEYATAALTTVTATTRQSAEVVGTAFKTLFARIQQLKFGETLEDGVTLGKYSEALDKVGISIIDSYGELKKMDTILSEMGDKWGKLTEAQKVSLAQTVAGTRQYTQLVALMDNWEFFQRNVKTAASATGELNKQQDKYLESTQAHLDKLSASTERLYKSIIDSEGLNDLIDIFSGLVTGVAEYTEAIGGSKSVLLQLGSVVTKVFGRTISQSIATSISNIKKLNEQAKDFDAQAAIIQQFKGVQVTDESYYNLVKMAEAVNNYKDTLSKAQIEEANMLMERYNEAVNARDMWQEAKTYAENYYKFFTDGKTISLDETFSDDQLKNYLKEVKDRISSYEQNKIGDARAKINKGLDKFDAEEVGKYIGYAQDMVEMKLIKNEQLEIRLRAILDKYSKSGPFDGNSLSINQAIALEGFADVYGEVADEMIKDNKKFEDTVIKAQRGALESFNTGVNENRKSFNDFIKGIDVQALIKNFTDMSGQIMFISSAIESIGTLPNIWNSEDLTIGEKILQTTIALGNVFNGFTKTIELTHTIAEILRGTIYKNATAWTIEAEAQKTASKNIEENTTKQNDLKDALQENKHQFDQIQKEYVESSEKTAKNTNLIDDNTRAIKQQTEALKEQSEIREQGSQRKNTSTDKKHNKTGKKSDDVLDSSTNKLDKSTNKVHGEEKKKQEVTKTPKNDSNELSKSSTNLKNAGKNIVELKENLDETKEKVGETTEALKKMGGGKGSDGGFKSPFTTLKADLKTIFSAIRSIPPTAWVAAAAIASIGTAIWVAYEKSSKAQDQINNLKKASEDLQEEYNTLSDKISDIESSVSGYKDLVEVLNGCTKGTKEWRDALDKVNSTALDLLSKYPELAKVENLFTRSSSGALQIDEKAYDKYLEKAKKTASIIQTSSIVASSTASQRQVELDKKYLLSNIRQSMQSTPSVNPSVTNPVKSSQQAETNFKLIKDNYDKLSNLTEIEYRSKLKQIGIEDQYIDSLTKYQKEIDKNAKEASNCATEMSNVAIQLANIRIGDNPDENSVETQLILAKNDAENKTREYTDKWLESVTDKGISKISGGENKKYLDLMKELKNIEGFEDIEAVSNGVQGTDNNRRLAYRINGEEQLKDAEYWASIVGEYKAQLDLENVDYEEKAKQILEPIKEALGGDSKLADALVKAVSSGDYNSLSAENIEKIKTAQEEGSFYGILSEEQSKELGLKAGMSFNSGVELAIEQWDPKKSEKALESKIEALYKSTAKDLDIDEEALKVFVDGLRKDSKVSKDAEEDLVKLAEATIKFQKALKTLGKNLDDNQDLLAVWSKSQKSAAELGMDTVEAVGELRSGLKDLLDVDLDEQFLKENFELIQKAIRGDIKALNELEAAAGKEFILNLKVDGIEEIYNEYNDVFNQLANTDLTMNAVFNDEQALAKIQEFFAKTKLGYNEAQAVLNKFGYKGKLKEIKVPAKTEKRKVPMSVIEGWKTYTSDSTSFYSPAENNLGYKKITVPGNTYKVPIYKTEYRNEEYEVSPASSYWVLESADGSSTDNTIQYSGLSGSVISNGRGQARSAAISSGAGRPSSGGGGGGSSSKPKVEKHKEDKKDIYHDVNISLSKISNGLNKVQAQTDQLVGKAKIDNLTDQFKLLNEQIDKTSEKINIAKKEMQDIKSSLQNSGVKFNIDGTISNYAAAYDAQLAILNNTIDRYNSLSSEGQESYQSTLDAANENFDKFLENIGRYDEILTEEIPEMEEDIYDAILSQIELKLEAFNQEIEIRLDMSEAEKDWNEFYRKVILDIDEDNILDNTTERLKDFMSYYKEGMKGVIQVNTQHIQDILNDLKAMDNGLAGKFYSKDGVDNRAQALEDLKTYYEQLMEDLEAVQDLSDEIHESYVDMIDEAQEKFDEQISAFETINSLLEHDKNVISMIYGEEAYSSLSQFYDRQEENYNKQLDFQRQQVEFWQKQMEMAEKDSDAWEAAKENWISAVDAWNSAVETAIENLQDKYLNAINSIFQNLNNQITNGMGLNYIETQWDLVNRNADQYLDTVNSIYQVQQLQNKYLDAIEKSDNPKYQQRLNELMKQETDYLREQDKLSQYDLDRANLKYEIALKQIALEEAQQNKNKLRLRRDSQGNYTYQYTADQDAISSIQQEISDLYNQLYNLDKDEYRNNLDELYSVWVEFQEKMSEAAQINDPEQRSAKELLIKEQYGELINSIVEKNENIQSNLYQSTMSHLFDLYDQNIANYEDMSADQKAILDQFINDETNLSNAAFDNLFDLYNINIENFKNMSQEQQDILMNNIVPQWNSGIQTMADKIIGEGGFTQVCKDAFEELESVTKEYMDNLTELQNNAKVSFDDLKNGIDNVIIDTEKLLDVNDELINKYDNEINAIRNVIDELNGLINTYKEAEEAAKKATEEAYKYWQQEQNKNAVSEDIEETANNEANNNSNNNTTNNTISTPVNSEPVRPSLNYGSYIQVKPGTIWYADSYGGGSWGPARSGSIRYINNNGSHPYNIDGLGWIRRSDIIGYDTGGYTGSWSNNNGRLAMLHQKELVLNANDTSNMLNAITILRDITANLGATLLNKMASISAGGTGSIGQDIAASGIEQIVTINAEFPNATKSREIEEALNNLVNRASQHIQKS